MPIENSVSVEAGSKHVVGYLTQFVAAEGDLFVLNGLTAVVGWRESTSSIYLEDPWPGQTLTDQVNWALIRTAPYWSSTVTVNTKVTDLIAKLEAGGILAVNAAGPLAKRATYNNQGEGFTFIQTDINPMLLFVKTGPGPDDWSPGQRLQADRAADTTEALVARDEARTYAGQASTSASQASGSASTATTQAGIATTKAGEAATSASSASGSATSASNALTNATTQAGIATTKAGEASGSATTASNKAAEATTAAQTATTKAGEALASAQAANDAQFNASRWAEGSGDITGQGNYSAKTHAENAAGSATAAGNAQTGAANALKSFNKRFLGEHASDPATDNEGEPLIIGALYWNTATTTMRVYRGAQAGGWVDTSVSPATVYNKTESDSRFAPLDSPALTGNPTAPTPAAGDNDTSIATTAFVKAAINNVLNGAPGALDTLKELADALGNDANFASTVTTALGARYTKTESDGRYVRPDAVASYTVPHTFNMPAGSATDPIDEIKELNTGAFSNFEIRAAVVNGLIGPAAALFHRPGAVAYYFGLDKDNKWRYGGYSAGANSYEFFTEASGQFVTNARMANMASGTFKARKSATAGPPEDININDLRALTGQDEIYLSNTVVPNGSAWVDLTLPAAYTWFEVIVSWACPNVANSALYARLFHAGGELTTGYYETIDYTPSSNVIGRVNRDGTNAQWQLAASIQAAAQTAGRVILNLDPGVAGSRYPHVMWQSVGYLQAMNVAESFRGGGFNNNAVRATTMRLYFGGGAAFAGGHIILRGYKIP